MWWSWRLVDNKKCWFPGRRANKSLLRWPTAAPATIAKRAPPPVPPVAQPAALPAEPPPPVAAVIVPPSPLPMRLIEGPMPTKIADRLPAEPRVVNIRVASAASPLPAPRPAPQPIGWDKILLALALIFALVFVVARLRRRVFVRVW
jgi:hypothetical protein